ncbi:MAG: tetratricopeptide repeat protein [Candidatus Paceibacterota bacterium]
MEENIFTPKVNSVKQSSLTDFLYNFAKLAFVATIGLLPVWFVPEVYTSLGFTKSYFALSGLVLILILLSLYTFRNGTLRLSLPVSVIILGFFVLTSLVSALLSGDRTDAILGDNFEIHTVGFFILLFITLVVGFIFGKDKVVINKLFTFLSVATLVLLITQVLRLFLGPEFLSFSLFVSETHSYFGSFNDLALLAGLVVVVSLMVLQNVYKSIVSKLYLITAILLSLLIMSVVNFYLVWLVVGIFSLVLLLQQLSTDTWFGSKDKKPLSKFNTTLTFIVALTSFIFIIIGSYVGEKIISKTGINYLEIRPSFSTTVNLANNVFEYDALLGVGPNRFSDAWRLYKDPMINQTEFWNTDFNAGSSFLSTLFVTTGILGGLLFIFFILSFLYSGYRTLFKNELEEYWYKIGVVSYVVSLYLWVMTILYVPSSSVLLLTATFTGMALAVYIKSKKDKSVTIDINAVVNKHQGVLLIVILLITNIAMIYSYIVVTKQYLAQTTYAKTLLNYSSYNETDIDLVLQKSQTWFAQDTFVAERAKLKLAKVNSLLSIQEPTKEQEEEFRVTLASGVALTERAIILDPTNPYNHALLASFYALLNPPKDSDISIKKETELNQLFTLDPTNPSHYVLFAQLSARFGDASTTRLYLNKAINLKNDYTEALFLLSQLDIAEGNTESAIKTTRTIANVESSNPTRQFQLGILLSASNDIDGAIKAFERAIALDNNYANARYFLALSYLDKGEKMMALEQLNLILVSNPDNESLKQVIKNIEDDNFSSINQDLGVPVEDVDLVNQEEDVTVSSKFPDTDLVTSLNQGATQEQVVEKEAVNDPVVPETKNETDEL